ncbi:hypothetical protein SARC_12327 [Sphaeroforma arctica JP610]|uniref:Endonuclease/exonuclease/phosphatase domain-containing protein n=1 Tax=Sphaeroforma arctica JP610 TaxID=667725 RepID=A0A0L0FEH4_9EUKA|nr:hypothetical protein SARC_12327 [Sphaeroforma arctica JP610]KNC75140.1 hypothetical protein SARC_12327 [Sphaeroforma arctica JP610]|eukprot:XP_014149042.1 hypothetical protein SARC_12327 [Sphaeroforma arctica JP610]
MMSKSNARAQAKHPRQDVKMKRVATEDKNLSKLRVVTYNVNWGFCLAGLGTGMVIRIHNAIMESNADLVCLQETHEGWQTYLERNFKGVYPYMIFKHHLNPDINHQYKEGSSAGGSAFLSKYPIKETFCGIPDVPGSFFPGTMIGLRSPVGVIYVLNVHLRPQISNAHKPSLMAVWSTGTVRKSEIKYLLTKMSSHKPSIIVGDFNEGHGGDAVRWLKYSKKNCNGKGYKDGLSEYAETAVTWKWPLKMGLYLKGAYDHVFYNPTRIRCVGCHVMSAYELVSDHMPVVADMVLLPHTVSTTFPTPSSQTVFNEPVPSTVDNPSPKVGTHVSKSTLGPRHTSPAIVMKDSGSFVKLDLDGNGNAILETNVSLDTAFNSRAGLSLPATSRTALQSSGVDAGTTAAENRSSKCGPGGTDRLTVAKAEFGKDPSYGMDVFEEDFYDEEAERQRQSEQRIQYRKLQRSVSDSVTYL